ncbi:MAG: hypothetical protein EXR62_17600 [Chloroflexi bacterium]|nr:hypothetical protein [Chloroflexota bacterium]
MRQWWIDHISAPVSRTLRSVPLIGFIISAVLVAYVVNIASAIIIDAGGPWWALAVLLMLLALTVTFIYIYDLREQRRRRRDSTLTFIEYPNPPKHRGLIFLFSNEDPLREAVRYHSPVLQYYWLVITPEYRQKANIAMQKIETEFPAVLPRECPLANLYDAQSCYRIVKSVFEHEAVAVEIPPGEIIADITGGTKPMSMGMILACLEGDEEHPDGFHLEHIPTRFEDGKPSHPLPPIEIRVTTRSHTEPGV